MKKKIIIIVTLLVVFSITGCSLSNNPTSKVEEKLSKYQMLDKSIDTSYTLLTTDTNLDNNTTSDYQELIKNQYKNLEYEIKDENIDGDTAIITTQIKVKDYKTIINKYNKEEYSSSDYHKKVIEDLKTAKDKVTYTIDFVVKKDEQGNWKLQELEREEKQKLVGMN